MSSKTADFVKMRAVNLFADAVGIDEKTQERAERVYKSARMIHTTVRVGRSAASKGNVVLAWLEAAEALLDAVESYAAYRQSQEVTKQLEAECEALREQMTEMRMQSNILKALRDREQAVQTAGMERSLSADRARMRLRREQYDACKASLQGIGAALIQVRRVSAQNCPKLVALERTFYNFANKQIAAAIELLDPTEGVLT